MREYPIPIDHLSAKGVNANSEMS